MDSRQRLECIFHHQLPDRVPIVETDVAEAVWKALMPAAEDQNEFNSRYLDVVVARASYRITPVGDRLVRGEYGAIYQLTDDPDAVRVAVGACLSPEEPEEYLTCPLPDPNDPIRFAWLDQVAAKYKKTKMIAYDLRCCLLWAIDMMGFENFMLSFMEEPEYTGRLLERIADVNVELARNAVRHGADIIFDTDDYAYNSGPFFSPALYEEYVYPHLKRMVDAVHAEGGYLVKHTDGNIMRLLPGMVETGIDGIQSIDPLAGMDLGEVKRLYGDRITLWGNIDCGNLMTNGTPEQVRAAVRRCMEQAKAGGGYAICSSNSILSTTKPENYRAMLDEAYRLADY